MPNRVDVTSDGGHSLHRLIPVQVLCILPVSRIGLPV